MEQNQAGAGAGGGQGQTQAAGNEGGFDSIKLPDFGEAPPPGDGKQEGGEGQGEQGAGAQGGQATQPPPRLLAGRFKAVEELEQAYDASGREGRRLYEAAQKAQQDLEQRQARIAELEAEIARRPQSFKALSAEEEAKLKAEDHTAYMEYLFKKDRWERDEKEAKSAFQSKQAAQQQERETNAREIEGQHRAMLADPQKFPRYGELVPVMDQLLDMAPMLAGQKASPKLLYYAAYGMVAHRAATTAKGAEDEAAKKAAAEAAALAQRGGQPGAGQGAGAPAGKLDDFNTRIVNAGKRIALPSF